MLYSPGRVELVVTRSDPRTTLWGSCILCWLGPSAMAGHLRTLGEETQLEKTLCDRCLDALELVLAHFESSVGLHTSSASLEVDGLGLGEVPDRSVNRLRRLNFWDMAAGA